MRLLSAVVALSLVTGCAFDEITGPDPVSPAGTPAPTAEWTVSGSVVSALTAAPVGGATLVLSGRTAKTDGQGRWTVSGTGSVPASLSGEVAAAGHLTRHVTVRGANGRTDAVIDLIRDSAPFSLPFYRELVRDGFESRQLEPLRRWTSNPSIYVDTRNGRGGVLTAGQIDDLRRASADAIARFSGRLLALDRFETGASSRGERQGWITIEFFSEPDGDYCGESYVGSDPGNILLNYDGCPCGSQKFSPNTVSHEMGHALGFYHVDDESALMHASEVTDCRSSAPTGREEHHASLAYRRPNGSTDIDRDGQWMLLAPGVPRRIICRR